MVQVNKYGKYRQAKIDKYNDKEYKYTQMRDKKKYKNVKV